MAVAVVASLPLENDREERVDYSGRFLHIYVTVGRWSRWREEWFIADTASTKLSLFFSFQASSSDYLLRFDGRLVGSYTLAISRMIERGQESNEQLHLYVKEILIGLITTLLFDVTILLTILTDEKKLIFIDM